MTVTSWTFWGATDLSSYVILLAIFVGAPIMVVVALSKTQHSRLKCIYYCPHHLSHSSKISYKMSISLKDYSTFQYMLARPSIASAVTSKCSSFVFYDGPKDDDKLEWSHNIICHGDINTFNYYICCLLLLPSHILGMSQWISAEDTSSKARKAGDELRRFRYSYYGGFLNVDTRHLCVDDRDGSSGGGDEQFRLVEYMECSISVWMLSHAMFVFGSAVVAYWIQKSGMFFSGDTTSLSSTVGIVYVGFHVLLACTGANTLFGAA